MHTLDPPPSSLTNSKMVSTPTTPFTVPNIKLNDGHTIPVIGFGTGTANYGKDCTEHVLSALKVGYRYLDGAQQYRNSGSIRDAFQAWGGKRDEVYILTKCGMEGVKSGDNNPRKVLESLLFELDLPYVDMFLIHNPFYSAPLSLSESWKVMEQLKKEGLTRSIGVSNYREEDLLEMEPNWEIPPAVNQIELHPYVYHADNVQRLLAFQQKHNIAVQAYAPLSPIVRDQGGPVDPIVERIAAERGVSASQILLAWAARYSHGCVVTNPDRQKDQLESVQIIPALTASEVDEISEAGKGLFSRHFQHKVWDEARP